MSVIGLKVPGASNSKVVPKASPTANPSIAPRYRSQSISFWTLLRRSGQVLTQSTCSGVSGDSGCPKLFFTVLHLQSARDHYPGATHSAPTVHINSSSLPYLTIDREENLGQKLGIPRYADIWDREPLVSRRNVRCLRFL